MKRSLKWILGVLGSLLALVAVAAAALLFWIDPNVFRDDFEALAAKQGVVLKLDGELSWRFFPELQIVTHNTSIAAPDAPDQPIARLNELSVAVALMPLLDKEVIVRGLAVDGLEANLIVDAQGRANWQQLGKTDNATNAQPEAEPAAKDKDGSSELNLAMESVTVTSGKLSYTDNTSGLSLTIDQLDLSGEQIALDGSTFPARLSARVQYQDAQQSLNTDLKFDGNLSLASDFSRIEITNSQIGTGLELRQGEEKLNLNAELGLVTRIELPDNGPIRVPVLSINQGKLTFRDGRQDIALNDLQLTTAFVPGETSQSLSLSSQVNAALPAGKFVSPLVLESRYRISPDFNTVDISQLQLSAKLDEQSIDLSGGMKLTLTPLSYQGSVKLKGVNPGKIAKRLEFSLPEMAKPSALSFADASVAISGGEDNLKLSNILLHLDATEIKGSAEMGLKPGGRQQLALEIDVINLDDYLPPVRDEAEPAQEETPPGTNPGGDDIDLSALKDLNMAIQLKIGQMIARNIPFSNVALGVDASGGKLKVAPLSGKLYDSPFTANATASAASTPYTYQLSADVQQLPVGKLLKDLKIDQRLSGTSDVKLALTAKGNSVTAIEQSLDGNIELTGKEFQFQGINVERAFCRLVAAAQGESFTAEGWPTFTQFSDTTTRITFKQGVAKIEKLDAGVSRLALSGEGKVNLRKSSFDMVFNTKLTGNGEGVACAIKNKNLLNRNIPIRCKADFDSVGATACLPDMRVAEDIAKEKIKDKVDEKAKDLLQEKLGTEKGEAAKEVFKQLFKKN